MGILYGVVFSCTCCGKEVYVGECTDPSLPQGVRANSADGSYQVYCTNCAPAPRDPHQYEFDLGDPWQLSLPL